MACMRKLRNNMSCQSEFHSLKIRKTRKQSWRRSRQLLVPSLRVLEESNSLAHSFSRGFCTQSSLVLSADKSRETQAHASQMPVALQFGECTDSFSFVSDCATALSSDSGDLSVMVVQSAYNSKTKELVLMQKM